MGEAAEMGAERSGGIRRKGRVRVGKGKEEEGKEKGKGELPFFFLALFRLGSIQLDLLLWSLYFFFHLFILVLLF